MAGDLIDFADLAARLLDRAEQLVEQWLPGGTRQGHNWMCAGFSGGKGRSLGVNVLTGAWGEFAADEKGGDLISLYAAIHGINNGQAARRLMTEMGWQKLPVQASAQRPPASLAERFEARGLGPPDGDDPPPFDPDEPPATDAPAPAPIPARAARPAPKASKKRAIVPVPVHAGTPTFKHYTRGQPARTWEYRYGGDLLGFICRFETSDGGKEIIPYTWCVDEGDDRGLQGWRWHGWEIPRPLYLPMGELGADSRLTPVVIVEGEKCADAGHQLLGGEFDFVSWPGGAKAWDKAGWDWLRDRVVILWPDADSKRKALNKAERDANVDPDSKPLLGAMWQPGMLAMIGIGKLLQAELGCQVTICPIPEPGMISDGWDIADAIDQGWTAEQVREFLRGARSFVPPGDVTVRVAATAADGATQSLAGAGHLVERSWRGELVAGREGIKPIRENIMVALDGVHSKEGRREVPGMPEVEGLIAFNEFTNDLMKLSPTPWNTPAGEWAEVDELLMGEWLMRNTGLPSMARATLEEAVRMVAYRHRYHPVRQFLQGLKWDGTPRLSTWLRKVCLEPDEWDDADPLQQYLARVGTFYIQGMCARVLMPGCKFDYMLILEGAQGVGKSTLFKVLAGDWFADTGLVLGDKDSYQQLQGRWLYEFGELDSFGKAEVTKIKSFIASASDYFRASFDRRARAYPRQVVFGGTTNERHYLTDPTGNRRFWPLAVTRDRVDVALLAEIREQLFAEAMNRIDRGLRMHPTLDEERALFEPQQQTRTVENAIEAAIARYLYDDLNGQLVTRIGTVELLGKIGIGVEKLGPGRYHEKQAASAMRRLGWLEDGRAPPSVPGRPRMYQRPKDRQPTQGDDSEASDAPPF